MKSDLFEIEKVYGSPESSAATGEIMKVNSLFPSKVDEDGQTKVMNFQRIFNTKSATRILKGGP